ncbi:MAG: SusD/RagB family nutrient-binding outer membrane lipoprotein, partial [Arenibacter algicola]|nr:SusD/RagB family nutrient-binding outer membrane lipoprotein [Arenibacter algicola]
HGHNLGIPPDVPVRNVVGGYPAGGLFDDGKGGDVQKSGTLGGLGEGINPIMLSSFVDFIRAEAALTSATGEDPKALLLEAVQESMDKVYSFEYLVDGGKVIGEEVDGTPITIKSKYLDAYKGNVTTYLTDLETAYDAADDAERLDIIITEYYKSLFGNGVEAYNNLRRTSSPSNVQPMLEPNPGVFIWSAYYPIDFVDRNQNVSQKADRTGKGFWDITTADAVR